jgi:hypothetical protein
MLTPNNNTMNKTPHRKWYPLNDKFVRAEWLCSSCGAKAETQMPDMKTPKCECGLQMEYNGILLNCGRDPLRAIYVVKHNG